MEEIVLKQNLFTNRDCAILGNMNFFRFKTGQVINEGRVLKDYKKIGLISRPMVNLRNYINGDPKRNIPGLYTGHLRYNKLPMGLYSERMSIKIREGYMYMGLDIDPVYIGRPQS